MTTRGLIDEITFHLCELHKIFLTQSRRVAQTRLRATGERAKRRDTIKIISNHSDYMNVKMFTVRRINWKWFSQQADVARGILCVFFCISGEGRKRKWNSILLCSDVVCDAGWIMCGDWEKRNRDQACVWWCNFFPSLPFFWSSRRSSYAMASTVKGDSVDEAGTRFHCCCRFTLASQGTRRLVGMR